MSPALAMNVRFILIGLLAALVLGLVFWLYLRVAQSGPTLETPVLQDPAGGSGKVTAIRTSTFRGTPDVYVEVELMISSDDGGQPFPVLTRCYVPPDTVPREGDVVRVQYDRANPGLVILQDRGARH